MGAVSIYRRHAGETGETFSSGHRGTGPALPRQLPAGPAPPDPSGNLKIKIADLAPLNTILVELETCDWVVYIQPPPKETSDPADVLKYLARYLTGGPISDRRLIEVKDGRVYFWARSKDKSGRQVRESLPTLEFIRCWTLHILPKGFTKSRCYGGWSNTRRQAYQQTSALLQARPAARHDTIRAVRQDQGGNAIAQSQE